MTELVGTKRRAVAALLLALSAAVVSAHAEEVQLTHRGLALNARLETAGDDWPGGTVILMTHGTLAHNGMEIMETLQELFAEAGVSSLAITLGLGLHDRQGTFPCALPHRHRHEDALDEIGAWLEWLKARGVERIVLLGHSRGGNQVAWFAAERAAPEVRGLLLIAPATWDARRAAAGYEERFEVPLSMHLEDATDLVASGKPDAWLEQAGFLYCAGARVTAGAFASYYAPEPRRDTPTLLESVRTPTLVFAGTEDTAVPGLEVRLAPLAEAKRIRLMVLDGADHFFRDLYADEIVEAAVEFIEGL